MPRPRNCYVLLAFVLAGFSGAASAKPCALEPNEYGLLVGDCLLSEWTFELAVPVGRHFLLLPNLTPTAASSSFYSGIVDFDTTIDNNGPKDAGAFDVSAMVHVYEMVDSDGDTIADGEQYHSSFVATVPVGGLGAGQSTRVGVMQIPLPTNSTLRFDLFINADSDYSGPMGRTGEVWESDERDQRLQYSCWLYGEFPLYQAQTGQRIPLCR